MFKSRLLGIPYESCVNGKHLLYGILGDYAYYRKITYSKCLGLYKSVCGILSIASVFLILILRELIKRKYLIR